MAKFKPRYDKAKTQRALKAFGAARRVEVQRQRFGMGTTLPRGGQMRRQLATTLRGMRREGQHYGLKGYGR